MREKSQGNILLDWKEHHAALFGRHAMHLRHSLDRSELFTDEALARLIENSPRESYHVNTRSAGPDGKKKRREGEFGELSGKELLECVAKGEIWINLRAPQVADRRYGEMLADMYREFETRVPGLETYKHLTTILISSPNVYVPYHCDVPGQMLWQIRGRKRVWVYPANEPFMSQSALEKLIIGEFHETDMPFHDWFDECAMVYDLEPGWMLHWPLNCPHRVENHDCVNVSVTTEHYTNSIRNAYGVNYANGLLRKAGFSELQRQTSGAMLYAKLALAAGVKFSGIRKSASKPYQIDFRVDPDAPDCVRDIEPYMLRK
ncbi:MAG: transcriptional regulator [Rhizobiaceae bacterium]